MQQIRSRSKRRNPLVLGPTPRTEPSPKIEHLTNYDGMGKLELHSPLHTIKSVINVSPGHMIFVRNIKKKDRAISENTLVKVQVKVRKKGGEMVGKYRGLNLNDLLAIKRNWNSILKAMVM